MNHESEFYCPDCDNGDEVSHDFSRRSFVGRLGLGMAALTAGGHIPGFAAQPARSGPAEDLIRELYGTFSPEQKSSLVFPWNHPGKGGIPARLGAYNSPFGKSRIGDVYTKDQQELIKRTLQSILSGDESYDRISRKGEWDSSGSFEGCGATIFGDPTGDKEFAWLFTGHHLTLRCDGNSMPGAAFGGPIYYGHSAGGYTDKNVFYYQTEQIQAVYEALDPSQRKQAISGRNPGGLAGVKLPNTDSERQGIAYRDLNAEQKKLVENVMRVLLDPFRSEDADEAMEVVKAGGGMDEIHLAFCKDQKSADDRVRWHSWRLEGPGFIWNFRVLPHVHCFVNISTPTQA